MALDGAGNVWLATQNGLYRTQDGLLVAGPGESSTAYVRAIGPGAAGRVWFVAHDGRLAAVEDGELRWAGVETGTPGDAAQFLAETGDGAVWIGVNDGLLRWQPGAPTEVDRVVDLDLARTALDGEPGHDRPTIAWERQREVLSLRQGPQGVLWESTAGALLRGGQPVLTLPAGSRPGIRGLTFDRKGTAWIVTGSQGLHALRPARVKAFGEAAVGYTEDDGVRHREANGGVQWFQVALILLLLVGGGAGVRLRQRHKRRRVRKLEAEVARLMADCEGCRLTVELSRERDAATRQAEKSSELERLKSDLFADISHELRTPLTLTLGPLRDLRDGTCGELPPAVRQQVELASRNAEQLLGFVDEMLDTARMEAGRLELRVRRGDLVAFLADLAERFAALAERRGVLFRFQPPPEPIPVWGDPNQLYKIFANLLSNAMGYTPEGGRVEMTVEHPEASGTVVVTVRDEGPGIAAEDRERIFDRFYRLTRPTARRAGGTGLGLPLARRLAELHGGRLTLESTLGAGSAFLVELRLGRAHFAPRQVVENEPWQPSQPHELPLPAASGAVAPQTSGEATDPADRTTVLIVDDHAGIRTFVRRHLEPEYRVEEAADGAEGLTLARDLLPDLVVSDVTMPKMDGLALCHALKEDPELDWVPVILLTKQATVDDKLTGLGEGADDYLTKPFDARELKARVDNLIASRQRLRERFGGDALPAPRLPLAPDVRLSPDDRQWLERVHEAIEAKIDDDDFSVEELAKTLAVHRGQLHKRLKKLTGTTPVQLIGRRRLEHATALLETEAASVSEVAYAVGFKSVAHFSNRFSERFGQSPSTWRRQRQALTAGG